MFAKKKEVYLKGEFLVLQFLSLSSIQWKEIRRTLDCLQKRITLGLL